VSIKHIRK